MKRLLLFLPLLIIPPVLVAGYFLHLVPTAAGQPGEALGTREGNLQAARLAYERAERFASQARTSKAPSGELLLQAVVQYRVCLAYEQATTEAGQLFDEARHNLEASQLLLVQQRPPAPPRPAETRTARVEPPPQVVQPAPVPQPTPMPQVVEEKPKQEPRSTEEETPPARTTAVGPDGITYEPVDRNKPPR